MRSPCYTPYSNVRRKVIACLFAKYSLEMPTAIPASVADSLNPKTFVIQILFDPGQDIFYDIRYDFIIHHLYLLVRGRMCHMIFQYTNLTAV